MKDFKVYQTSGMLNFLVSEASDARKKEQTLSGDIVSFTTEDQSPIKIVVDIDSTGWTGCNVSVHGNNLLNYATETVNKRLDNTGGLVNSTYAAVSDFISVKPSIEIYGRYLINSGSGYALCEYDKDKQLIRYQTAASGSGFSSKRYTLSATTYFIRCTFAKDHSNDPAILYPSSSYVYEPYKGTTLSVTFPDEVGTVTDGTLTIDYDGSVTLQTGGQTYTLTSESPIETLIGDNNIWSDAGPVSVTYPI